MDDRSTDLYFCYNHCIQTDVCVGWNNSNAITSRDILLLSWTASSFHLAHPCPTINYTIFAQM